MNALMQSLEARKLFAAVTATLANGKLTITGTDGNDSIYVTDGALNGSRATAVYGADRYMDGAKPIATFQSNQITSIFVDMKKGDDQAVLEQGNYAYNLNGTPTYTKPVLVRGGDGNDNLIDSNSIPSESLEGGAGDDFLYGGGTLDGGAGNDTLTGYTGEGGYGPSQLMHGGDGADVIDSGGGADTIFGDGGDDLIHISNNNDRPGVFHATVDAGDGNDKVYADGSATVHLGVGNDYLLADYHPDDEVKYDSIIAYGDSGRDRIEMSTENGLPAPAKLFKAYGGNDNDTLLGGLGQDVLSGEAGNDLIKGGANNDTLNGGTGDDLIYGEAGNDDLFGSDGRDTLYGGTGQNRLFGQSGIDAIHSKNGEIDQIIGSQDGDVLDNDGFDVLKAS